MNKELIISKKTINLKIYYFILFSFYCLSHVGIFFIKDAIFYDDWTIVDSNQAILFKIFSFAGSPWTSYIHSFLLNIGPSVYRLITFILNFLTGILFDLILIRTNKFNLDNRFLIISVFLTVPVNISRVLLITLPYTICYFLFFLAWYLKAHNKYLSYFIFFFSFITNSLLCFYFIQVGYDYYIKNGRLINIKRIYKYITKNFIFISLPFFFFILKNIYLKPNGLFKGYNDQFSLTSLLTTPTKQFIEFSSIAIPNLGLLIITITLSYVYLKKAKLFSNYENLKWDKKSFIIFSIFAIIVACFPYWILGHTPILYDWKSRHQLLMPLGLSFTYFTFSLYVHKSNIRIYTSLILSIFMIININLYYSLAADWHKQKSIISLIANDDNIKNSEYIVFDDLTKKNNAFSRTYSFYEWNGILDRAFSNQKRIGVNLLHNQKEFEFINKILYSSCKDYYKMRDINLEDGFNKALIEIREVTPFNLSNKEKLIRKLKGNLATKYKINSYQINNEKIKKFTNDGIEDICK